MFSSFVTAFKQLMAVFTTLCGALNGTALALNSLANVARETALDYEDTARLERIANKASTLKRLGVVDEATAN